MTHKFDPINMSKLDNAWRRENLPAVQTLEQLGLSSTDIVADIGCGIGYFSMAAAEILKKQNKVFALDTSDEMLDEVEKRAKVADATNIITVKNEEYNLKLPNELVTFAILVNVLHEVDDKQGFVIEIKRILKQQGKLAIIEWEKKSMEMGPPESHRVDKDEVIEIVESCGFELNNTMEFAEMFYGVVFVKN